MNLSKGYKDIKRLRQIVDVLFKNELGYVIDRIKLKAHLPFHKRLERKRFEKPSSVPIMLRRSMEELSGAFIKLGQLLSLRPDLVPEEYCSEFSKLLDEVKPFEYQKVKEIVEKELKKPISKVFLSFGQKPIAAASVGQVHKAILRKGDVVAVKVQRPNIKEIFKSDIDLLYHLAHLLERYIPEVRQYNPVGIVKEFEHYTANELDYITEGRNIDVFCNNFRESRTIKIPKVYWDYTTKKILTMEYIKGLKISEIKEFRRRRINKKVIARNLVLSFIEQVIEHGFFHADPHPGNVFVLKGNRIALLDFGIVGNLEPEVKGKIEDIFVALVTADRDMLTRSFIELGIIDESVDVAAFEADLTRHWGGYYDIKMQQTEMGSFFYDTFLLAKEYNMRFPTSFVLLLKAMITAEGFSRELDPDLNFVRVSRPVIEKMVRRRKNPKLVMEAMKKTALDFSNLVQNFPAAARDLVELIKNRERSRIGKPDVKELELEIDRSSNRIAYAIVIAGLVIGGSVLQQTEFPPLVSGISLASIVAYITAIVFLIMLVSSIAKEKEVLKK